jgi:hypothetical protein
MPAAFLAVIERGYRGSVEVQYGDLLHVCRGLHSALGGVDVILRGSAVGFALAPGGPPEERSAADTEPGNVPDPRDGLTALIDAGAQVWVDEPDLREIGCGDAELVPGSLRCDTDRLAKTWHEYQEVWFL